MGIKSTLTTREEAAKVRGAGSRKVSGVRNDEHERVICLSEISEGIQTTQSYRAHEIVRVRLVQDE